MDFNNVQLDIARFIFVLEQCANKIKATDMVEPVFVGECLKFTGRLKILIFFVEMKK